MKLNKVKFNHIWETLAYQQVDSINKTQVNYPGYVTVVSEQFIYFTLIKFLGHHIGPFKVEGGAGRRSRQTRT